MKKSIIGVILFKLIILSVIVSGQTADVFISKGNEKFESGDYRESIANYSKAIEIDVKNSEAFFKRARTKERIGDLNSAIDDYSKVIDLNPSDFQAYIEEE